MIDLSDLDDDYNEAPDIDVELPNGKYEVKIIDAGIEYSRKQELPLLVWTLEVVKGDLAGGIIKKTSVIKKGDSMKFLKHDLKVCGLELEKFGDLENRCAELVGIFLAINKTSTEKNGRTYSNIYVNKKIDLVDAGSLPEQDDIPF